MQPLTPEFWIVFGFILADFSAVAIMLAAYHVWRRQNWHRQEAESKQLCVECHYPLAGLCGPICPECGLVNEPGAVPRGPSWLDAGIVVGVIGAVSLCVVVSVSLFLPQWASLWYRILMGIGESIWG